MVIKYSDILLYNSTATFHERNEVIYGLLIFTRPLFAPMDRAHKRCVNNQVARSSSTVIPDSKVICEFYVTRTAHILTTDISIYQPNNALNTIRFIILRKSYFIKCITKYTVDT